MRDTQPLKIKRQSRCEMYSSIRVMFTRGSLEGIYRYREQQISRRRSLRTPSPARRSASPPTTTRYSRSVLINRLFMFNAAPAFSAPSKVFEALRRKARDCEPPGTRGDENGNGETRELREQGNAFASRRGDA